MKFKVIFLLLSFFCLFMVFFLTSQCTNSKKTVQDDPMVWKKIKIDFKRLDENGLSGPIGGKVAMNYEFCLHKDEALWKKVKKVDKTLQKSDSKGRIGCKKTDWLCIGSTHQAEPLRVLYDLAKMEEIAEIREVFFE